ncbi:hypothetical protein GZ78_08290 [Endozoicomonas numazuensis]|uniref:Uncharacterized protein n=1 Tax=Endozoicomonas numazuensis TaxID=1137799 RepID=A0A081NGW1_9GAMM|nr:hypothetical protein GZ78_08290 [Endozoicomonas numazuensis]
MFGDAAFVNSYHIAFPYFEIFPKFLLTADTLKNKYRDLFLTRYWKVGRGGEGREVNAFLSLHLSKVFIVHIRTARTLGSCRLNSFQI